MVKKLLKAILLILIAVILLFAALVLVFRFSRNADKKLQQSRIEQLRENSPGEFIIPDTRLDDGLRLNQIRYLATHNSYHRQAGQLQLAVLELAEPGEAEKLHYSHLSFYDQLEIGVRSFEFDIRYYRGGSFENIHVPLVDNRGHSPSVRIAAEELKLWSDRNPSHVPVIILIETKGDWRFLDPFLKKWSTDALLELDGILAEILGDKLIRPSDIAGEHGSVRDALLKDGWPTLADSRGSFIFVYHESDTDIFSEEYFDSTDRIGFYMSSADSSEASFLLRNEPEDPEIEELVKQGFIVRTRADADCITAAGRKQAALASGAQIVSTDFPKGYASGGSYNLGWNELLSRYVY